MTALPRSGWAALGVVEMVGAALLIVPLAAKWVPVLICGYDDAGARAASLEVDRAGDTCGSKPCWKPLSGAPPAGASRTRTRARASTACTR
jgi:hypothetical protein